MSLVNNSHAGHRATVTTPALDGLGCRAAITAGSRPARPAMPLLSTLRGPNNPPVASTHGLTRNAPAGPLRAGHRDARRGAGFFDAVQVDTRTLDRDLKRAEKRIRKHTTRPGNTSTHQPLTHGPVRFATLACTAGVAFFLRAHGAQA